MGIWILAAALSSTVAWDDGQLVKRDRSEMTCEMLQVGDGIATINVDGSPVELPLAEIQSFRKEVTTLPSSGETMVQWVDGSWIHAQSVEWVDGGLTIRRLEESPIVSSPRSIRAVVFKTTFTVQHADEWNRCLAESSELQDHLIVERAGRVDSIEGLIRRLDAKSIEFIIDDQDPVTIPLERISAILLRGVKITSPESPRIVVTTDGLLDLNCQAIQWRDNRIGVRLVCGESVSLPAGWVAFINFAPGSTIELTQLTPTEIDWQPLLASAAERESLRQLNAPRFGRSFSGHTLTVLAPSTQGERSWVPHNHGIALRAGTRIVYRLGGEYQRFSGQVGFSPDANRAGHCRLVIELDGQVAWERPMDNRDSTAIPIELNLHSAQRMQIQLEYFDGRSVGDELHLCDLILEK